MKITPMLDDLNYPTHLLLQLKLIQLVFLPPNTTSVLQLMDQGVNLKAHYWNQLVLKVIEDIEKRVKSKITILDS